MKEKKPGRYQKILSRPDKKRPMFLKEVLADFLKEGEDCLVLNLKVLTPKNSTMTVSWSEKSADESP